MKKEYIVVLGYLITLALVIFLQAPKLYYWQENTKPTFNKNIAVILKNISSFSPKASAKECPVCECDCTQRFLELAAQKKFEPAAPYDILILGDSFINGGIGVELERSLVNCASTTVARVSKASTGLTRRDYFDWNEEARKLLEDHKPNIVFVMFGANDAQGIVKHGHDDIHYGTPEWDVEYAQRVAEFMDVLSQKELRFYWIGNPIARDGDYRDKMAKLNLIYETQAKNYKNGYFIETWDDLKCGDKYCDFIPDDNGHLQLARESDGIHVTSFGGTIVSKNILNILSENINYQCQPSLDIEE